MRMAMIRESDNYVYNIIEADSSFVMPGYILRKLGDLEVCEPGDWFDEFTMTYNKTYKLK